MPFLLDRQRGPFGTLLAHVARANPIWRRFDGDGEVMAVFLGPHGYVSPDCYESPDQVPTWNYAAVHAYGVPAILRAGETEDLLARLSAKHESELAPKPPWSADKVSGQALAGLRKGVVAFAIAITRIEGKFKLGQNKAAADAAGAARALHARGNESDRALALSMEVALRAGEGRGEQAGGNETESA